MFGTILALLILFTLYSGWLYYQQPKMIFFPEEKLVASPEDWGLAYEDVALQTSDGLTLHGWFIPHTGARKTLLLFHGNAGNISHRRDSIAIYHRLGVNVFIFDYRGYGRSDGKPGEAGLYHDARSAWRYLTQSRAMRPQDIILFGRSLGGAVAAKLATEVPAGALILESTFSSARDLARALLPLQSHLVPLRFDFNTTAHVRQIKIPLLIIHSPEDEIIPYRLGENIYRAANEPKSLFKTRGDHNNGFLLSQPAYEHALGEFISTLPVEALADKAAE